MALDIYLSWPNQSVCTQFKRVCRFCRNQSAAYNQIFHHFKAETTLNSTEITRCINPFGQFSLMLNALDSKRFVQAYLLARAAMINSNGKLIS